MKRVTKVRKGSRLIRRYDTPGTPFQRVQACPEAEPRPVADLERVRATTDPFRLSQRIDQHLERLWPLAPRATRTPREKRPRPAPPRAATPWRGWTVSPTLPHQPPAPHAATRAPRIGRVVATTCRTEVAQERRSPVEAGERSRDQRRRRALRTSGCRPAW